MDGARPAPDLEPARQRAVLARPRSMQASIADQMRSRPRVEAGVAARRLVRALHLGDREARGLAHGQHLGGGGEGIGTAHLCVVAASAACAPFSRARSGRSRRRSSSRSPARWRLPGGVEGAEHHAVGVAGERRPVVEDDVLLRVEGERAQAGGVDAPGAPQPGQDAARPRRGRACRAAARAGRGSPPGRWRGPCR